MDLSKLTPAPWYVRRSESHSDKWIVADADDAWVASFEIREAAEKCALAFNDLDVKLRRGWHTEKCTEADQWYVPQLLLLVFRERRNLRESGIGAAYQDGHDVGLLTKADKWYKENVEKGL